MDEIFEQLQQFKDGAITYYEPVDEISIDEFEHKNSVSLPDDFKLFIKKSNGIEVLSTSVYGLGNKQEDLFEVYRREHTLVNIPMPGNVIPFSPDGGGNFYCFDTTTNHDGSCKVIFWTSNYSYTEADVPEVCNESFNDWFQEVVIDWTIEDNDDVLK